MSILGFNFAFGARDDGFNNALTRAGAGIKGVSGQVSDLADRVSSGNFFNALNTLHLDRIGDQLSELKGQGNQLETSLEGNFRDMAAEVRPMLAQMGLTQEEFRKATSQITSTAYGLNVGAGEVAESFRAIRRAGAQTQDVFKAMGIGMKELTLVQKATGMSAETTSALIRNLTESYGFTTGETSSFLDEFTNLTQNLGIADVAFGSLQETLGTLDDVLSSNTQFSKMNREEQAAYVKDQLMGVQRLTKAFMGLGKTPEEAQAAATSFFKTLSTERKSMDGLTIGLGDMGETFKALAQESGFQNVDALFSNISSDPTQALQQIVAMQEQLSNAGDPAALARFNAKLQEMMGGLSFIGTAGAGLTQRLAEVDAAAAKGGKGLVAMAKAAHTAKRSLDDVLSMYEDRFEANLMKLTGNTRSQFVAAQKTMYAEVSAQAKKMASNNTWGPLFKQFVAARKIGAAAFFLPMQRDAEQTAAALSGLDKAVGMGGLGGRFEAIKQLGILGFFVDLNKEFKTQKERLKSAEASASKYYAQLAALGLTADTLKPALMALGTAFASLFVAAKAAMAISKIISIGGSLISLIGAVGGGFLTVVGAIASSPVVIAAALAALVYGIGRMFSELGSMPQEAFESIGESIADAGDIFSDLTDMILAIDVAQLTNGLIDVFEDWVVGAFKGLAGFITSPEKFMPILRGIGSFAASVATTFLAALVKVSEVFYTIGERIVGWIKSGLGVLYTGLDEYVLKPIGEKINSIKEFFGGIYEAMIAPFKAVADWWRTFSIASVFRRFIVMPLASVMDSVANFFYDFANVAFFKPIEMLVNKLSDIIKFFYDKMPDFVTSRLDKLGLGKFASGDFKADFQLKREGGEARFADAVMQQENAYQRSIQISVEPDEMVKRQDETNRRLGEVVDALKSQKQPPQTPLERAGLMRPPIPLT